MAGNAEEPDEDAWKGNSEAKLDQARDTKDKVRKALEDLEQKQADKIAKIAAQRRHEELLAAAAAARAKREQEERVRAEFKKRQAAELQAKKDSVKQGKRDEANALKAATANYKAARRAEYLATQRAKRIFEMQRSESFLQNANIACYKQYRMWYVAVQTCEMRLEAREKRPPSELFVDNVQAMLEKEHSTLKEARAALKGLVDEAERLGTEMAETHSLLTTGCSRENVMCRTKKLEMSRSVSKSSSAPSLPVIVPKMPNSPKNFMMTMFGGNDTPSQEELLNRVKEETGKAFELSTECAQVLENCRKNVTTAMARSNAALDHRRAEIAEIRKSLEQEKLDAEGSIRDASARLSMLKMRASHHPQTQEEQDEILLAEGLVKELHEHKLILLEDWRCKSAAFKIDEWCRNLTPTRAATLSKVPSNLNETGEQQVEERSMSKD